MTPLASALTSALLDFLWQGVLIACLVRIATVVLRSRSAQLRYLIDCGALVAMTAAPIITMVLAYHPAAAGHVTVNPLIAASFNPATTSSSGAPWLLWMRAWTVPVWSIGVLLFSIRLIWGCGQISAIKRRGTPAHPHLLTIVEKLAARMRLSRAVRVLMSHSAGTPGVAGLLRPVILLPISALTGLTPDQLEAVLAHELAHIRRYDPLVNALQVLVETLLFYHPAIWWVSARIRHERELCCDDLALRCCGDALCYARALTALEKLRIAPVMLAIGSTDGPLLYRIRRIMGLKIGDYGPSKASGVLALLLALACLAINPTTRIHAQDVPAAALYRNVGVQADTAGAQVVEPIRYPESAVEKAIQGTVVAQVDVDTQGNVTDARVLSGPPELRKAVLRPILTWRFQSGGSASTRQISVTFTVPSREELENARAAYAVLEASAAKLKAEAEELQKSAIIQQNKAQQQQALEAKLAAVETKLGLAERAVPQSDSNERASSNDRQQQAISTTESRPQELQNRLPVGIAGKTLARIDVVGLSNEQRDQVIKQLPVKIGDTLSNTAIDSIRQTLRQFGDQVGSELVPIENHGAALQIAVPGSSGQANLERQIVQTEAQLAVARKSLTDRPPDLLVIEDRLKLLKSRRQAYELMPTDDAAASR